MPLPPLCYSQYGTCQTVHVNVVKDRKAGDPLNILANNSTDMLGKIGSNNKIKIKIKTRIQEKIDKIKINQIRACPQTTHLGKMRKIHKIKIKNGKHSKSLIYTYK